MKAVLEPAYKRDPRRFQVRLPAIWMCVVHLFTTFASADFVEIARSGYSDGQATVVSVTPSFPSPGILVVYSETPIPVQNFDLKNLPPQGISSIFLSYDSKTNSFDKLLVGGGKEYLVKGSFTLNIAGGALRITTDSNNRNPYCSVVRQPKEGKPSILGFVATEKVLHYEGEKFVALLEANQFHQSSAAIVEEYVLESNLAVTVKGQPLTLNTIGLPLQTQNPCLYQGAALISKSQAETLKESPQALSGILEEGKKLYKPANFWDKILLLQITNRGLTYFDYTTGQLGNITKTTDDSNDRTLCVVAPLTL